MEVRKEQVEELLDHLEKLSEFFRYFTAGDSDAAKKLVHDYVTMSLIAARDGKSARGDGMVFIDPDDDDKKVCLLAVPKPLLLDPCGLVPIRIQALAVECGIAIVTPPPKNEAEEKAIKGADGYEGSTNIELDRKEGETDEDFSARVTDFILTALEQGKGPATGDTIH